MLDYFSFLWYWQNVCGKIWISLDLFTPCFQVAGTLHIFFKTYRKNSNSTITGVSIWNPSCCITKQSIGCTPAFLTQPLGHREADSNGKAPGRKTLRHYQTIQMLFSSQLPFSAFSEMGGCWCLKVFLTQVQNMTHMHGFCWKKKAIIAFSLFF